MNNKLVNFFMFTAGAALGSFVTWRVIKATYEQIANEEIESVKAVYSKNHTDKAPKEPVKEPVVETPTSDKITEFNKDYYSYLNKLDKCDYNRDDESLKKLGREPYVISPEDFNEHDEEEGWSTISLMYFADDVLTDEDDIPIENVTDTVGDESLTHFGEYEEDSVYVRNERMKTDFEILKDNRKFHDLHTYKYKPHDIYEDDADTNKEEENSEE